MIYMNPQVPKVKVFAPGWGHILTPSSGAVSIPDGAVWCADSGVFTGVFEPERFFSWLESMRIYAGKCVFVAVPDSVSNAVETLYKYRWWAWRIKDLGYPVAYVAQDGAESLPFPPEYDALFIGGSTEWKLSPAADACILRAQERGAWVHIGRVNSQKRIRHFQLVGADSCDGTTITYEPDVKYRCLNKVIQQPPLFTL